MLTDPVVEQAGFDQWVKNQKLGIEQRKLAIAGECSATCCRRRCTRAERSATASAGPGAGGAS
jgi:hypothetical protein